MSGKMRRVLVAALFGAVLLGVPVRVMPVLHAQTSEIAGTQSTPEAQSPEKEKQEEDENAAYRRSDTVRWLGSKLGLTVDQAASAFEILNFVVLAALIIWFLMKTLPKTFVKRNTDIQKDLVEARTATEEASARLTGVEERLAKLDGQIAAMKVQAEKDAAAEETRMRASAEEEKLKILAAAEQEIAAATVQAQRQIQQYAAELAIEHAAKKLVVTAETDRLLVQGFAKRLADEKGGQN